MCVCVDVCGCVFVDIIIMYRIEVVTATDTELGLVYARAIVRQQSYTS